MWTIKELRVYISYIFESYNILELQGYSYIDSVVRNLEMRVCIPSLKGYVVQGRDKGIRGCF